MLTLVRVHPAILIHARGGLPRSLAVYQSFRDCRRIVTKRGRRQLGLLRVLTTAPCLCACWSRLGIPADLIPRSCRK